MFKFRSFMASTFSKMRDSKKFYSKTSEQLERVLSLADALGAAEPTANADSSPTSADKTSKESTKTVKKSGVEGAQVIKKIDAATKRGKRCGNTPTNPPQDPGPPGDYIVDKCDILHTPNGNPAKWRTLSFVAVSFVVGLSAFVLSTKEEHGKPDYIPYDYMYKRVKRFAWGDGRKTLFHGHNNVIPEEEEKRLDRELAERKARGENITMRYRKSVNEQEEKIKRRERHAKEELERRRKRRESQ